MFCHPWNLLIALISIIPTGGNVSLMCPPPTSCVSTASCTATHSAHFLRDLMLFQCGSGLLCCPPKEKDALTFRPFLKSKTHSTGNSLESESSEEPSSERESLRSTVRTPEAKLSGSQIRPDDRNSSSKPLNGLSARNTSRGSTRPETTTSPTASTPRISTNSAGVKATSISSVNRDDRTTTPRTFSTTKSGRETTRTPVTSQASVHWEDSGTTARTVKSGTKSETTTFRSFSTNSVGKSKSETMTRSPPTTQSSVRWETSRTTSRTINDDTTFLTSSIGSEKTTARTFSANGFSMPWEHRNKRLLPERCGAVMALNKIVEGDDALVGEYPWMALVGFTGYSGGTAFVCGGTLINHRYVLTAAHCLHKEGAKLTHVRLGEFDLSTHEDCNGEDCYKPAVDIMVEKVIAHDNWNEKTFRNDIGLLRLNASVSSLGMTTVSPICLPTDVAALNITDDYRYETVGWGLTGWREHSLNNVLQKTTLDGISETQCNAAICPERGVGAAYCPILRTQICVQGVRKRDVCKGDSGGPLMTVNTIKVVQVGITSFKATEICGEDNVPTVFTRVDKYMEWILDHIEP